MTDSRALYGLLLVSPCAEARVEGIERWERYLGHTADLVPLLDDDAPVLRRHGDQWWLVEVRSVALVALQDRYRNARHPWPHGPVPVRAGMPVDEAERLHAALPPHRQADAVAAVEGALAARVQPADTDRGPCRTYLALQQAGAVTYELQEVDNTTLLTPLQHQIHAAQLVSSRRRPHVRFDGRHGLVGYLYRHEGRWIVDTDEGPSGQELRHLIGEWQRSGRGGVPRVMVDDTGAPRRHPSGQGLLTDGVVPAHTDAPLDYLRSVAAFIGQSRYTATLVV
ncbi:MAG: hypothetical protein ACFCVK_21590 [Acidimicrobiales bacterium]